MLHSSESALLAQSQKEALQGIPVFTHAGFVACHLIPHSLTGSLVLHGMEGRQHIPCEVPVPQGGPAGHGLPCAFTSQHLQHPGKGSPRVWE